MTSRILFDEKFNTFKIYFGSSLYALCITPELSLEHLYWGKQLHSEFDLRYLSQSSRMTPFLTSEESISHAAQSAEPYFPISEEETLEALQDTWRKSKISSFGQYEESEYIKKKRIENLSWRLMAIKLFNSPQLQQFGETNKLRETVSSKVGRLHRASSFDVKSSPSSPKTQKFSPGPRKRSNTTSYDMKQLDTTKQPSFSKSVASSPRARHSISFADFNTGITSSSAAAATIPLQSLHNLKTASLQPTLRANYDRMAGKIGKGALGLEYSDHGTGDFRSPSFVVVDTSDGSSISPLRYRRHKIIKGKEKLPDHMPGIRADTYEDATTLIITMGDIGSGLEVDLIYVAMHNYDALIRRSVFRNIDTRPNIPSHSGNKRFGKLIQKACSMTVDFESTSTPFHLLQLSGSWARERYIVETKLTQGIQSIGSARGVSGHQHNPFGVITIGPPSEIRGEVKGFSLIYSGNFILETDLSELGRLRVNMGIHPMGFQWHLAQNESFSTPECVLVRSSEGLGGMSRVLHRLFLDALIPRGQWSDESPPILLNSWEAKYFNVNHHNIVEMAVNASRVGIDMIVVDDGWFGQRDDDSSSLGDWSPNVFKFPNGLKALVEDVNAAGCKFGIWFEPEMVSEESLLHRMHPDWYLHVPGRPRQIGRNQYVLDLSRKSVVDYLYDTISTILSSANIEYVKWDCNRPLTEVYSQRANDYISSTGPGIPPPTVWQSETSHRYVMGLYELQDRLTKDFPHVLLENCSSGGGRFDPGMLYFSSQIWCSDNTDAIARMRIQYGTSIAYPARCIGSHVSCVPNHITGNFTRSRTRGLVAMCGTYGFELDIMHTSPSDIAIFREQILIYRSLIASIVHKGDLYRLWDPFKVNLASWMYVSRDKSCAVVFAFSMNSDHWSNLVPRLMLQGLLSDTVYEVSEPIPNNMTQSSGNLRITETDIPVYQLGFSSVNLSGEILMSAGLPIKFYTLDDSVMFYLRSVKKSVMKSFVKPSSSSIIAPMSTITGMGNRSATKTGSPPPAINPSTPTKFMSQQQRPSSISSMTSVLPLSIVEGNESTSSFGSLLDRITDKNSSSSMTTNSNTTGGFSSSILPISSSSTPLMSMADSHNSGPAAVSVPLYSKAGLLITGTNGRGSSASSTTSGSSKRLSKDISNLSISVDF